MCEAHPCRCAGIIAKGRFRVENNSWRNWQCEGGRLDYVQKDINSMRSCREKCLRRDLSSSLTTDSMSRLFFDMMESIFSSSVFSVMSLKT